MLCPNFKCVDQKWWACIQNHFEQVSHTFVSFFSVAGLSVSLQLPSLYLAREFSLWKLDACVFQEWGISQKHKFILYPVDSCACSEAFAKLPEKLKIHHFPFNFPVLTFLQTFSEDEESFEMYDLHSYCVMCSLLRYSIIKVSTKTNLYLSLGDTSVY